MDAYLVKPVSMEHLRATLERWLPVRWLSAILLLKPVRPMNSVLSVLPILARLVDESLQPFFQRRAP